MEMSNQDERILRTWLEYLIQNGHKEIAALLVESELQIVYKKWAGGASPKSINIDLPTDSYAYFADDKTSWDVAIDHLGTLLQGHLVDEEAGDSDYFIVTNWEIAPWEIEKYGVQVVKRIKLSDNDPDWKNVIRELIAASKNPNQGVVTEKVFTRRGESPILYNEMKFGSQSEVRIAQELERRGVLFFPLPLAIKHDTGEFYKDHKEPDFLICHNGRWGILEVAHHRGEGRYEKDKEKDAWFKKEGILCVEHYPSETCYRNSKTVVDEFLEILAKHK